MSLVLYSFLSGCLGAWLILKTGTALGTNDVPNHRSSHSKIVPKGGGIGILLAFLINAFELKLPVSLWIPCLVISVISLWGDRVDINPRIRLAIQFGCSMFFLSGFYGSEMSIPGAVLLPILLAIFLTGTANFYNFMDGIDGIAGITGVTAFGLLAVYTRTLGCFEPWGWLSSGMALACLGFLMFNFPKAKVFMGDVGSILLGFSFACLVVQLSMTPLHFFVMAGFLFPFYCDELITIWVRLKQGESLLVAHRKHVYQLLANELKIPHYKISLGYGAVQVLVGISLMWVQSRGIYAVLSLYVIYGVLFGAFAVGLHKKAGCSGNRSQGIH